MNTHINEHGEIVNECHKKCSKQQSYLKPVDLNALPVIIFIKKGGLTMGMEIPVSYRGKIKVDKDEKEVYNTLSDLKKAKKLVPGLDSMKKLKENIYHWKFKPMGMKGVSVTLEFDTEFTFKEPSSVKWESIKGSGNAEMKGEFKIKGGSKGTTVEVKIEMVPDLPVPRMFRKIAEPFVKSEFEKMMKKFIQNVEKELTT